MKKISAFVLGQLFLPLLVFAQAKIFIDVGEARVRKSVLAIPEFQHLGAVSSDEAEKWGRELFTVVKNDLDATGLFTNVEPGDFLENTSSTALRPAKVVPNGFDFNKWTPMHTEFLIRGGYTYVNGKLTLEIYAYYVPQGSLIVGKKYEGTSETVRKVAHTFANDFMKFVTGKPSFFNSQIVVAIDSGPQTHREIYIADWDGFRAKPVTNHRTITISPAWSRDGEFIAYTAFVQRKVGNGPPRRNPDLFVYEIKTGRRWLVSYRDGINSGAEFLPDNKNMLVTLSQSRTADIYKMTLDGKTISPITQGPAMAMNVEPAISPDGRSLAFSSDRSGKPMIYTMSFPGGTPQRKTFAGHYNSTPTWSPDGKLLAFAGFDKEKNNFDLFVMNADGTNLQRLTSARKLNGKWANNEDPAFSPDGRHVLFVSDRVGARQLYMVNIDGTNERRITYDNKFYAKPKWGPLVE